MSATSHALRRLLILCVVSAAGVAAPAHADDYTRTRHPIVLVHGLLGFDQIGPVDYFFGVPAALKAGGAKVFVTQQPAVNSTAVRGEALLANLRALKAAHGFTRFNLIAHSMGGLDSRYVAAVAPELVASVTTVGTPHQGSAVADGLTSGNGGGLANRLLDAVGTFVALLSGDAGSPQDGAAALASLNSRGAAAFNAAFPDGAPTSPCGNGPGVVNGVRYYSATGNRVATNILDISDPLLGVGSLFFGRTDNDGLVGRCSAHWGTVLKDNFTWNHLDEVNQVFGLRGAFAPDPVAFYRAQANRLKAAGL